jgi:negative regulator of flagellin synthesis FlgM
MTRIDGPNPLSTSRLGQGNAAEQTGRADDAAKNGADGPRKADLASISARGRVVAEAMQAVQSAPDVRAAKVAELKAAIAGGTYHSSARDIAQRLIAGGTFGED